MAVQSIVFEKSLWTPKKALEWLKIHNYKPLKIDIQPNTFRFRLEDPKKFKRYSMKNLGKGIKLTLAY